MKADAPVGCQAVAASSWGQRLHHQQQHTTPDSPSLSLPCAQLATGMSIVRSEGVTVLWAGWTPAIARAMLYGGAAAWHGLS